MTKLHLVLACGVLAACQPPGEPPTEQPWAAHAIAAGGDHALLVTDGDQWADAGLVEDLATPVPQPETYGDDGGDGDSDDNDEADLAELGLPVARAIAVGSMHACVLDTHGAVSCWGDNSHGALGAGRACDARSTSCVLDAGLLPTLPEITAIAAGADVSCALGTDQHVYCWGDGANGRLGGSIVSALDPPQPVIAVGAPLLATSVRISDRTVCAIDTTGVAWCWGGSYGDPRPLPFADVTDVAVGDDHGCAISSKGLVCWGDDGNGQAGDAVYAHACAAKGDCTLAETPVAVDAVRVAVGGRHTCAIDRDGVTWCWGDNTYGQLGHGGRDAINAPAPVPEAALPAGATDVVAGDTLSCAVTAYARAWCWGLLGYEAE